ncbi:hypothetical protein [Persicirhabdus sediminis]|uniref:Uncharacterized protein n=1 Tax=Persicirhabdus sediminis TaxID=454144 RepID=A0A8J7MFS5_9BACT|nr:hypothetical protein [Persicirhabdus sediminis]MBK1791977.1 hypothetical protein [Persicirhabdus sediminis]
MLVIDIFFVVVVDFLFWTVFSLIGHVFVRIVTLNKVKLDWGKESGSEALMSVVIGIFVLLAIILMMY